MLYSQDNSKAAAGFKERGKGRKNTLKEIASLLKEAEIIDTQEDNGCKTDPEQEQEVLQKKLSDRKYLKSKIEEALESMKEENREKINLTDR